MIFSIVSLFSLIVQNCCKIVLLSNFNLRCIIAKMKETCPEKIKERCLTHLRYMMN